MQHAGLLVKWFCKQPANPHRACLRVESSVDNEETHIASCCGAAFHAGFAATEGPEKILLFAPVMVVDNTQL